MPQHPKLLYDAVTGGVIDISSVLPIVETPEFQKLRHKMQLGMTHFVFHDATHTRFAHSVGSYHATCRLADRWLLHGVITKEERDALVVYALIHDVGHPAYSHVAEDFVKLDDDERTAELVRGELHSAIIACGANPALVEALVRHQHPLWGAVHDKSLGREKLDYLERDGFYTGMGKPSGLPYVRKYICYVEDKVAIDEKMVDHVLDVLTFYMKMYKNVYFRKALVIAQRMFHTIVYRAIRAHEISRDSLYYMTDNELLAHLYLSNDHIVQAMYPRLRDRQFFKEGFVIRPEGLERETRLAGKSISVMGIPPEEMHKLVNARVLQKGSHRELEELEGKIAKKLKIPRGLVLMVPVFNPERFRAKDVNILESDGKLHSLRERKPEHFKSMEEIARSHAALRVCAPPEFRELLAKPASGEAIYELVKAAIS